jgi:thiol-disulfide isomerase/thioredoxin
VEFSFSVARWIGLALTSKLVRNFSSPRVNPCQERRQTWSIGLLSGWTRIENFDSAVVVTLPYKLVPLMHNLIRITILSNQTFVGSPKALTIPEASNFKSGLLFLDAMSTEDNLFEVTSSPHFQDLLSKDLERVSLINFYAPWANACQQMNAVVSELAKKYPELLVLQVRATVSVEISTAAGLPELRFAHLRWGTHKRSRESNTKRSWNRSRYKPFRPSWSCA